MTRSSALCLTLVLLLSLQTRALSQGTPDESFDSKRNLSRYDKIGPFVVPVGTRGKFVSEKIRDFIWRHWQQRRRGYAVVTFHSVEGEPSTSHMFIELTCPPKTDPAGMLEFLHFRKEFEHEEEPVQ
jgi:hypothetical protein